VEDKAKEEDTEAVAAALADEKKYGEVRAMLNDPDLGVSKKDIDKIKEEKETLPPPDKQI
jgi:hypothetical protein